MDCESEALAEEETRSSNQAHLFRRIAWRLQANAEGGRSERARGWTAKHWTSRRGRVHGGRLLSMSTLRLLVTNVLYRGGRYA